VEAVTAAPSTARGLLDQVLADVDSFVETAPQADDQTVVCFSIGELPVAGQRFSSGPPPPESRL
jgi:hypothetical protein